MARRAIRLSGHRQPDAADHQAPNPGALKPIVTGPDAHVVTPGDAQQNGRLVVFVNPEDIADLDLTDGQLVDIRSDYHDETERVLRGLRVVSYPTSRGCAAAYYPEANVLVPMNHVAEGSNTPISKAVIVRLEPSPGHTARIPVAAAETTSQ
ncbi:hypothetical protein E3O44_06220 [Cryobacterium algoricola]|uniref:Molybdopterin dinucleotide-binding domain-containing protein n=1 Tax=Cryobacterium algoricola TaxID=1259183 RepID=A0ABY2IEN3_9MICO|nr:hypothetical protein E3O44_06220 [Cryobacterium algoricola]